MNIESREPIVENPGFYGMFTSPEIPEHDFPVKA